MTGLILAFRRLAKAIHRAFKDPEFHALVSLMLILLISGTVFYVLHEDWSIIDAIYFCVMTMSTVGYGDLAPTSSLSKIFTIVYSLITIGIFVGVASKLAHAMLVRTHHPDKQA
jgi:voltage-gated potassium channel Kch